MEDNRSTKKFQKEKIRYKYDIFGLHKRTSASVYPVDEMKEKMNEGFLKYDCPSRSSDCEKIDSCCSSDSDSFYICGYVRSPDPIFNSPSRYISEKKNERKKEYIVAFNKEDRTGSFSRVTHNPMLLYVIRPKHSKTNRTAYQFFAMDISEVEDEVQRLNKSFGKDYWTYTPDDNVNSFLISLKHQFELEVGRLNIES